MNQLDLLKPIQEVIEKSRLVAINQKKLVEFCRKLNFKKEPEPALIGSAKTVDYWFLADSQAFCFWGYPKKWTISYQGKKLDGWWALLASFDRALSEGVPIFEPTFLAKLTKEQGLQLFAGEPEIPLLDKRLEILRGIGQTGLIFSQWLITAPKDALKLVEAIVNTFPGFKDVVTYKGRDVNFYKKAQLLVADLARFVPITGTDKLLGEADYKIPALLRDAGVLVYVHRLQLKIDARRPLLEGSQEEVEIRANMLWAVQLMLKELKPKHPVLTATKITRRLWYLAQDKSRIIHPYHLTRTINY